MKRISPNRIITAVEESFKDVISKPKLKTLALIAIAISLAKKLRIEKSRRIPVDVKHQKAKQNRLLRYLKNTFPMMDMMFSWTKFVLQNVYGKTFDV